MPDGLCECGCGETTKVATRTSTRGGHVKGQHVRFMQGHGPKVSGERHGAWRGGKSRYADGYVRVGSERKLEHRIVVEVRIGRALTDEERVHHVNEIHDDNEPENLWVFPDDSSRAVWHRMLQSGAELAVAMPAISIA